MTLPFCFLSLYPNIIAYPIPCLCFFKSMTPLVVMSENICGYIIYLFIYFAVLSISLISQSFSVSFFSGTKNLRKSMTVSKVSFAGKRWGGRTGETKNFLKAQMPGSGIRVVLKLFFFLLFNFVVGFLLSFCWVLLWCLSIFVFLPTLTTFYFPVYLLEARSE